MMITLPSGPVFSPQLLILPKQGLLLLLNLLQVLLQLIFIAHNDIPLSVPLSTFLLMFKQIVTLLLLTVLQSSLH